jgi:hypothetical protein
MPPPEHRFQTQMWQGHHGACNAQQGIGELEQRIHSAPATADHALAKRSQSDKVTSIPIARSGLDRPRVHDEKHCHRLISMFLAEPKMRQWPHTFTPQHRSHSTTTGHGVETQAQLVGFP